MPTPPIDSLDAKINALGLKVGNIILASTGVEGSASTILYIDSSKKLAQGNTISASVPVYIDSSSVPTTGAFPFSVPVSGLTTTATSFLSLTGSSTTTANGPLSNQIVTAATATSFTATGYIAVTITDSAGNITGSGTKHYITVGTLA